MITMKLAFVGLAITSLSASAPSIAQSARTDAAPPSAITVPTRNHADAPSLDITEQVSKQKEPGCDTDKGALQRGLSQALGSQVAVVNIRC